jgi:hypothetical protein
MEWLRFRRSSPRAARRGALYHPIEWRILYAFNSLSNCLRGLKMRAQSFKYGLLSISIAALSDQIYQGSTLDLQKWIP